MLNLLKVLNLLIICYFLLRTEFINNLIPSIWFLFLVTIAFFSVRSFSLMTFSQISFFLKKNIWILISLVTLLAYKFFNYGNFILDYMIQYLLFSIPFLIVGYYYSLKNNNLKQIIYPLLILLFLAYIPTIITYISSGIYTRDFIKNLIFRGNQNSGLIHFWPFISGLLVLSYGLICSKKYKFKIKFFYYVISVSFLVFIVLSGYMSGVFFLIISVLSVLLLKKKHAILRLVIFIPILIYLISLALTYLPDNAVSQKASAFFELNTSYDASILNKLTSNRWSANHYSIIKFIDKPFLGNGIYLEKTSLMLGDIDKYTTASGGHSFFIDLLAYMGFFSLPIIFIFLNFIRNAKLLTQQNTIIIHKNISLAFYAFFIAIFVSNIANSWLLFSSFDNFIFLIAGYCLGKLYVIQNLKLNEKI